MDELFRRQYTHEFRHRLYDSFFLVGIDDFLA